MVSFACDASGPGGAAGNGGVPVLWGLGGGSGAGADFQSPVLLRPRAVESNASARPGVCPKSGGFSLGFGRFFRSFRVPSSSWAPCAGVWKSYPLKFPALSQVFHICSNGGKIKGYVSQRTKRAPQMTCFLVNFWPSPPSSNQKPCGVLLVLFVGFI